VIARQTIANDVFSHVQGGCAESSFRDVHSRRVGLDDFMDGRDTAAKSFRDSLIRLSLVMQGEDGEAVGIGEPAVAWLFGWLGLFLGPGRYGVGGFGFTHSGRFLRWQECWEPSRFRTSQSELRLGVCALRSTRMLCLQSGQSFWGKPNFAIACQEANCRAAASTHHILWSSWNGADENEIL
jgi:hypothetical protein